MAKQQKKVGLKDRLKKTSVRETTRTAEVVMPGGGSLPAGVTGVAKLTRLDFDEITQGPNAGSQRFYCHGVCVTPKTFKDSDGNVHTTEGSLVQLSRIVLDDTEYNGQTTSFEENFAKAENRMKLLGIPTEEIDDENFEESILEFVQSSELFFKFRTWKAQDSDRVQVVLVGPAQEPSSSDEEDEVEVEEEAVEVESPKAAPKKKEPKKPAPKKEEPKEEEEDEASDFDPKAFIKIAALADKGDEKLQTDIADMAEELNIDTTAYEDWSAVAEAIIQAKAEAEGSSSEESEDSDEEAEEVTPEKGDIFLYEGDECEVLVVFPQSKKVNLKNFATSKTLKNIPWDQLEVVS